MKKMQFQLPYYKVDVMLLQIEGKEDENDVAELLKSIDAEDPEYTTIFGISVGQIIAWLGKQGSEPKWSHHKVDLSNCSEEYRKAYYDGWNNCNMQHSQCESEKNDVLKCLINGLNSYYEDNHEATWGTDKWSMPVKHIIEVLESINEEKVD